ncbi:TIGR03086 family metal-binding protein [Actinomadura kijaniata]|uniref:TIGR03086 family metal-binding protein n=1 Tax=Actinomadura kijaniata TaxID=46161 RepID=UPI00082958EE|nr:TIGR03086 family metal-binding protein [Actinomadura kijaniata]
MADMPDLGPAARRMADLVSGVADERLADPTPCPEYTVGDLIDHVNGLSLAFTWAAEKSFGDSPGGGPSGDASRLEPGWRSRIPERLAALAEAWRDPSAWQGMTQAGGVDLPGDVAGAVALNELVVHGWDLARAIGRPYEVTPAEIEVCLQVSAPQPGEERDGSFLGPPVPVAEDAPPLDRLIGFTGRDPGWTPSR